MQWSYLFSTIHAFLRTQAELPPASAAALVLRLLRVLRVLRVSVCCLSVCLWRRSTRSTRLAGVGAMPTPLYPATQLQLAPNLSCKKSVKRSLGCKTTMQTGKTGHTKYRLGGYPMALGLLPQSAQWVGQRMLCVSVACDCPSVSFNDVLCES